jgi:hypothetical protein
MYKADVIEYFGSQRQVAVALNISHVAVSKWPCVIPELRACQIEKITKGALKAEMPYPSNSSQSVSAKA